MKIVLKINWILVTILSLSTGLFKVLQQQEDIQLLEVIGFTPLWVTLLGVFQFFGGVMLITRRFRKEGAYVMIFTFALASIAVFANGMLLSGASSVVLVVMAFLVLKMKN